MDPDPDRQALDADPDPAKLCQSGRIKIHISGNQLESEAWQARQEEKFLQYPSYRGLEPYTR
jgi:hypothetical protein